MKNSYNSEEKVSYAGIRIRSESRPVILPEPHGMETQVGLRGPIAANVPGGLGGPERKARHLRAL